MSWYGQARGGGSCDGDFGMPLVERWRQGAKECCVPQGDDATSITCHLAHQTRHAGDGDQVRQEGRARNTPLRGCAQPLRDH